jgi:hypothetical protein
MVIENTNWLGQAAGNLIKEQVQPILDQYPLGIIEKIILKTVQFGNAAPEILGRFAANVLLHSMPVF